MLYTVMRWYSSVLSRSCSLIEEVSVSGREEVSMLCVAFAQAVSQIETATRLG